jgi:hypothetical protein
VTGSGSGPARGTTAPLGLLLAAVGLLAGCGPAAASFEPQGPCVANGRAPGAYPDLEELLPADLAGTPPTTVDSGRSCTTAALSTYASHGLTEVRYAGATWDAGGGNGTAIAVVSTPAPQPELEQTWVEEFYLAGARASSKTENIETSRPALGDIGVFRIETLNDLSLQTVLVWSVGTPVHVVIVATQVEPGASRAEHDARVGVALEASRRSPSQ